MKYPNLIMRYNNLHLWRHSHTFGQEHKREGERRASIVIAITTTMMIVETITGLIFGSMAPLASVFILRHGREHHHDHERDDHIWE